MTNMHSDPGESVAVFRFGEFTFDCGSHLLLCDGEERHLSPKAQQLLRILLLERPRAVSREELYDALWPSTFVCDTNMASLVSEVRRVLGDDARSSQYIRTVHGFGYAFAGEATTSLSKAEPAATLLCEGQRHPLFAGANSVGRAHDCRIVLTGPTASRLHAVIYIEDDVIRIEDLGSRNGTFVHGKRITRATVRPRELILFGVVQASIVRKETSTMPLPPNLTDSQRLRQGLSLTS